VERALLAAYGAALAALWLSPSEYWAGWLTGTGIALLLAAPYFFGLLVRRALDTPSVASALLVAAIGMILLTSVLDLMGWVNIVPFSNASLAILAMPLLMLAFGALLVDRQVRALRAKRQAARLDALGANCEHS
jgi:hypothetical protein